MLGWRMAHLVQTKNICLDGSVATQCAALAIHFLVYKQQESKHSKHKQHHHHHDRATCGFVMVIL